MQTVRPARSAALGPPAGYMQVDWGYMSSCSEARINPCQGLGLLVIKLPVVQLDPGKVFKKLQGKLVRTRASTCFDLWVANTRVSWVSATELVRVCKTAAFTTVKLLKNVKNVRRGRSRKLWRGLLVRSVFRNMPKPSDMTAC